MQCDRQLDLSRTDVNLICDGALRYCSDCTVLAVTDCAGLVEVWESFVFSGWGAVSARVERLKRPSSEKLNRCPLCVNGLGVRALFPLYGFGGVANICRTATSTPLVDHHVQLSGTLQVLLLVVMIQSPCRCSSNDKNEICFSAAFFIFMTPDFEVIDQCPSSKNGRIPRAVMM